MCCMDLKDTVGKQEGFLDGDVRWMREFSESLVPVPVPVPEGMTRTERRRETRGTTGKSRVNSAGDWNSSSDWRDAKFLGKGVYGDSHVWLRQNSEGLYICDVCAFIHS